MWKIWVLRPTRSTCKAVGKGGLKSLTSVQMRGVLSKGPSAWELWHPRGEEGPRGTVCFEETRKIMLLRACIFKDNLFNQERTVKKSLVKINSTEKDFFFSYTTPCPFSSLDTWVEFKTASERWCAIYIISNRVFK